MPTLTPANADRLRALAVAFIEATDRGIEDPAADNGFELIWDAMLACLSPVVARPCRAHDINQKGTDCYNCWSLRQFAEQDALRTAMAGLGLDPGLGGCLD